MPVPKFLLDYKNRSVQLILFAFIYALILALFAQPNIQYDAGQYYAYAQNLLSTGVYGLNPSIPDVHREPGYAVFLSLIMRLVPSSNLNFIIFFQSLFSFFCCALVFRISILNAKQKVLFFLFLILSPSLINARMVLYSETLAVDLIILFFVCLFQKNSTWQLRVLAGLIWGSLILTKIYLQYSFLIFILLLSIFWNEKKIRQTLAVVLSVSIVFPILWQVRAHSLNLEAEMNFRRILITTGKVLKTEAMKLPNDLPVILLSALGTNTCQRVYSETQCLQFDFRGADQMSIKKIEEVAAQYSDKKVQANVLRDFVLQKWMENPFKQVFGCSIEVLRLHILESVDTLALYPAPIKFFAPLWHFFGSILVLFWGLSGLRNLQRMRRNDADLFMAFAIIFWIYHCMTLSQVNVVARYTYPSLPFFYFFAVFRVFRDDVAPKV